MSELWQEGRESIVQQFLSRLQVQGLRRGVLSGLRRTELPEMRVFEVRGGWKGLREIESQSTKNRGGNNHGRNSNTERALVIFEQQ